MKFIGTLAITILAAVPALAAPQASASTAETSTSVSVSLSPQQTCLSSCKLGDVNCQAACVGVAHPNESQVNQTTECAGKCDQGDGSPAATEKFSQCVQSCIASYFPTTQTGLAGAAGTPAASAASNAASATGSAASAASGASGSAASSGAKPTGTASSKPSGSSTATGAAASASGTGAAASNMVAGSAVGLAGLFAALLAL